MKISVKILSKILTNWIKEHIKRIINVFYTITQMRFILRMQDLV